MSPHPCQIALAGSLASGTMEFLSDGTWAKRVHAGWAAHAGLAATALAAAGMEPRPGDGLDGVNLLPFLTGRRAGAPHAALFWRFRSQAAVLADRWKLLFVAPDHWRLFDRRDPAGETRDVAAGHPDVVARLRSQLEAWCAGQVPAGLPQTAHAGDGEYLARHGLAGPKG